MVAPPANQITDLWGHVVGVNGALERIRELRQLLNEMEAHPPEPVGRGRIDEMNMLIYYNDELEYLEAQLRHLDR